MRALVTGAGGFLGRHVVSTLVDRGIEVRAMVRPAATLEGLEWSEQVEILRADLRDQRALVGAFDGVDVLVHLAAVADGSDDFVFASTVTGTERLLAAMSGTGCRHLVLISSLSVYDWSSIGGTLDEDSPLEVAPHLYLRDGYAIAKAWQERVVRRAAEEDGFELTVLRPGFLWGRDHAHVAAMGMSLGSLHLVVGPLTRIPMTYVENCADLIGLTVTDGRARGRTFNVVDGPGERVWSQLGRYLRGTGRRGIRVPIPYRLAFALVRIARATFFRKSTNLPQILFPVRFEARLKPLRFTNRRVRDRLGWEPPFDLRASLARTFPAVGAPDLDGSPAVEPLLSPDA
jgi:UDP-glucose 4-epimerase